MLELIANYHCVTGEGPLWHPEEELLYWLDIPDGELYSYDPATDAHELRHEGERVGGFTTQESGDLLLFGEGGSIRTWSDGIGDTLIAEIPEDADSRFNDVIAGPEGRVYCGTMGGNLYCLDTDGRLRTLVEGKHCRAQCARSAQRAAGVESAEGFLRLQAPYDFLSEHYPSNHG